MKKTKKTMKKLITIASIILVSNFILIAQDDNINIQVSNDTTSSQYDKMLKYFLLDKIEVKQLYKVDLFQLALKRPNFSYEKKILNNSSIEIEGLATFYHNTSRNYTYAFPTFDGPLIYYFNLNIDYKCFYNTNKRIAKGKHTNGFSANYLSVGFSANLFFFNRDDFRINNDGTISFLYNYINYPFPLPFDYSDNTQHSNLELVFGRHEIRENRGYVKFGYGMQRRIGNIGFVSSEIKLGFGTNKDFSTLYITPEINIKAGFAIKSFKRK